MKGKKWHVLPPASAERLALLAPQAGGSLLIAQLLHNRGVASARAAEQFLSSSEGLSNDPFLMNDMDLAVGRVIRSLYNDEAIAIYGDYDADGVTGTALLTDVISDLGGRCRPYIPRRLEEGYGLNPRAVNSLAQEGVKLIITVDCGTNSVEEASLARSLGMDLIVTDHHTMGSQVPAVSALLNPKRPDSTYPFSGLASVGVAFKLAQALLRSIDVPTSLKEADLLDLVALGTVADLAPLQGENRHLVKSGLEVLNSTCRIGLRHLMLRAGLQAGAIDSTTIAYVLGPRLNAAGRIGDASLSYRLLTTGSEHEAKELAAILEEKNVERQRMTNEAVAAARHEVLPIADRSSILLSASPTYSSGIVGLVAGRLAEEFYKPAVVIQEGEDACRGSARSIAEFNIIEALDRCCDTLVQFGGHAQAAGFTIKRSDIPRFREQLAAIAEAALGGRDLQPQLAIEAEVALSGVNGQTIGLLQRLAPFGSGNPVPTFLSRRARVLERRAVGSQGDHLKLRLSDGGFAWSAIGFGLGGWAESLPSLVDVVYSLEENTWNGERLVQLRVIDLRPS